MEGASGGPGSSVSSSPTHDNSTMGSAHSHFNHSGSTSSIAQASTTLSPLAQPFAPRRRRLGRHTLPPGSDTHIGAGVSSNSDQPQPVSAVRMPSKRKGHSFARPGKWNQSGSRSYPAGILYTDEPVVKVEDIFAASMPSPPLQQKSSLDALVGRSEEDVADLLDTEPLYDPDLELGIRVHSLRQLTDEVVYTRGVHGTTKREVGPRQLSAVLINFGNGCGASVKSGVPNQGTERMRYLPLCSRSIPGSFEPTNSGLLTVLPDHRARIQHSDNVQAQDNIVWPIDRLPVELFDLITVHLARDDVKSMRLVNREFEHKVSCALFHTSVVPFNTELYDMIDEDKKSKGKSKMKAISVESIEPLSAAGPGGLQWHNAKEDKEGKVYKGHGLRVFQGFGPHIKRFGMSFEVSEKQMSQPPTKKLLDNIESYHGTYDWPAQHYTRFANLAGLENTADETSHMKAAFANLDIVQELALSIDSGLGWLSGPDKSLRSRIFERPTPVFGSVYDVPDYSTQAASDFWNSLQRSQQSIAPDSNLKESIIEYRPLSVSPKELDGLRGKLYANTQLWSSMDASRINKITLTGSSGSGVLYTTVGQRESVIHANERSRLNPNELKKEQKEWLLETQWAQQAFLESYTLAIADNPNFEQVTTLNISKLSSQFLPMLARGVFWDALPRLSEVILHVSPDWRTVDKDDAGFAETQLQNPSLAIHMFHKDVLKDHVSVRESIKKLNIGWIGGGEEADGMFARNANILPAPITQLNVSTAYNRGFGLVFNHVEHLTLSNCWTTPTTLEGVIKSHANKALKKLTLESVSLTAHPRAAANAPAVGAAAQMAQAMAAAMQVQAAQAAQVAYAQHIGPPQAAYAAQHAAQGGQGILQGFNPQQAALMQQQFNQQLQQLMNANQNGANAPAQALFGGVHAHNPPQMPVPAAPPSNAHWTTEHREGSWAELLNTVSPGPVFQDYLPGPQPWEEPLPKRPATNLKVIELKSCGYVRLYNNPGFDWLSSEADLPPVVTSAWFRARRGSLKGAMMEARDRYLGNIVQYIPQRELDALRFAWGLREGWEDRAKAEEAEFDGLLPGGTGRISGVVEKGMALVGGPATALIGGV